jgi:DNA-binding GntR family transcriptional regulator
VRRHGSGTFVAQTQMPLMAPFMHLRYVNDETGVLLPIISKVVRRRTGGKPGP